MWELSRAAVFVKFCALFALGGCGAETAAGGLADGLGATGAQAQDCATSWYATRVVTTAFGPGQSFGRDELPGVVLGPPHGHGTATGSLDVASLGNGGRIDVGFGCTIVDEPGPDFVVFENAFLVSGNPNKVFAELATVAVSNDGATWTAFPCTAKPVLNPDGSSAPPFGSCAGGHPVILDTTDCGRPVDSATSGGDAFDLADLGLHEARFVRITDRADLNEGLTSAFDLDAVGIVHGTCR
jgi:hypothetical protein